MNTDRINSTSKEWKAAKSFSYLTVGFLCFVQGEFREQSSRMCHSHVASCKAEAQPDFRGFSVEQAVPHKSETSPAFLPVPFPSHQFVPKETSK